MVPRANLSLHWFPNQHRIRLKVEDRYERVNMGIDKNNIRTQEEVGEPAPIDQVEDRVDAEMKVLEGRAKEQVAHGLQDDKLAQEAKKLKQEGERDLKAANDADRQGKP